MAMRCAYHLANADDIARQDSAGLDEARRLLQGMK
jgi:hypothetical protein